MDRIEFLKELIRYGKRLEVNIPNEVWNSKLDKFIKTRESLDELKKDEQLKVSQISYIDYTKIIIEVKQLS